MIKKFTDCVVPPNSSGEIYRVAERFAVVGAAGEVATEARITGWRPGAALESAKGCFAHWLENRSTAPVIWTKPSPRFERSYSRTATAGLKMRTTRPLADPCTTALASADPRPTASGDFEVTPIRIGSAGQKRPGDPSRFLAQGRRSEAHQRNAGVDCVVLHAACNREKRYPAPQKTRGTASLSLQAVRCRGLTTPATLE